MGTTGLSHIGAGKGRLMGTTATASASTAAAGMFLFSVPAVSAAGMAFFMMMVTIHACGNKLAAE